MAAMLVIMLVESINSKLFPLKSGIDMANPEAVNTYIKSLPATAFIILLLGYFSGSFVCGFVIRRITKDADNTPAILAGVGLTTVGIVNFFSFDHPWWVIVIGILTFIPATLLGFSLFKKQ